MRMSESLGLELEHCSIVGYLCLFRPVEDSFGGLVHMQRNHFPAAHQRQLSELQHSTLSDWQNRDSRPLHAFLRLSIELHLERGLPRLRMFGSAEGQRG